VAFTRGEQVYRDGFWFQDLVPVTVPALPVLPQKESL
jgi:hypothetical protein